MTDTLTLPDQPTEALWDWDLPRRTVTLREVIEALDPLLEAVRLQLGAGADRETLLDQLAATLSFTAREASLPLAHIAADDTLRSDLAAQAAAIGDYIVATTREVSESGLSIARHGEAALERLALRSRCDGHLWLHAVTVQLTGEHGGPHVMQLYNEWLHQIVLLRDALIPFVDWETLPIPLDRLGQARGLRALEAPRGRFVGDLLTKRVQHDTIIRMAQALFGIEADEAAYGFSTGTIVVLPASVGHPVATARKALLTWRRADIAGLEGAGAVRFRYAFDDYLAQPRSTIAGGAAQAPRASAEARFEGRALGEGEAAIDLVVTVDGVPARVDLGQALRGHRFSYRPALEPHVLRFDGESGAAPLAHGLAELFALPAIVEAESGTRTIALTGDPLVDLAVLGKIYPENTVIQGTASWDEVERAGKNYGAKFVLTGPEIADGA